MHEAQIDALKRNENRKNVRDIAQKLRDSQASNISDLGIIGTLANKRSSMDFEQGNVFLFNSKKPSKR